jgi:hypothetical protein
MHPQRRRRGKPEAEKIALESLMRFVVNPQRSLIERFNRASKSLLQLLAAPQQQLFECFGRQL